MEKPHNAVRRRSVKACAYCGEIFELRSPRQKYCSDCAPKAKKQLEREYWIANRERRLEERRRKRESRHKAAPGVDNHHEISLVAQAAREAGMTYGKYTAMLRIGGKV